MSAYYYQNAAVKENERLYQARMAYTSTTEPLNAIKREIVETRKSITDIHTIIETAVQKVVDLNEQLRKLSDERDYWKAKAEGTTPQGE